MHGQVLFHAEGHARFKLGDQLGLEPLGAVRIADRSTVARRRLHRTTVGDLRDPSAFEP